MLIRLGRSTQRFVVRQSAERIAKRKAKGRTVRSRTCVRGIRLESPVIVLQCATALATFGEQHSEVVVRLRMRRRKDERLSKLRFGLVVPREARKHGGKGAERVGRMLGQRGGASERLGGLVEPPEPVLRYSPVEPAGRIGL